MNPYTQGLCQCGCGKPTKRERPRKRLGETEGAPRRYVKGHNPSPHKPMRHLSSTGYVMVADPAGGKRGQGGRRPKPEHVVIVERVLGHPLPRRAVVHHVDGDKTNNANTNLVVCQNPAYHQMLHTRLVALRECGNASARKCGYCHQWDDAANMQTYRGSYRGARHAECGRRYQREVVREREREARRAARPL